MKKIYLYNPTGGGIRVIGNVITVKHKLLYVVGEVDVPEKFDAGELRVTKAALDLLGKTGVEEFFVNHLNCRWETLDKSDRAENDSAVKNGGVIYNLDRKRGFYLITYIGDNSTLITRDEY